MRAGDLAFYTTASSCEETMLQMSAFIDHLLGNFSRDPQPFHESLDLPFALG